MSEIDLGGREKTDLGAESPGPGDMTAEDDESRKDLGEDLSRPEKKLSFSPRVETYDIPRPAVTLKHDESDDDISDQIYDPGPSSPPARDAFPNNFTTQRLNPSVRRQSQTMGGRNATPQNTPRGTPSPVNRGPDWYEELTDGHISMFKQVFELLDRDGGGTINADELFNAMKDLDIEIKREEIENVLQELDKDGNGEIDFDEFLYAMSMTDKYIDQLSGVSREEQVIAYSKRQRLFFTAITRFAIKNSLNDIERYYAQKARQAPHVISFYTAGARLIGLNDRQLEQELKRLQKASKNQDSPYAKLPFMTTRPKKQKQKRKKQVSSKGDTSQSTAAKDTTASTIHDPRAESDMTLSSNESDAALLAYQNSRSSRRSNIMPGSSEIGEIQNLLTELANQGSIVARLPGIHLVPAIRTKLDNGDKEMLCSSIRKKKHIKGGTTNRSKSSKKDGTSPRTPRPNRLVVPKMAPRHLDMPTVPMSEKKRESLTIEDVPYIRQKVSRALGKYYGTLQKNHVKTAWDHWDHLNVESMESSKFKDNFRKVYGAYSPHKEEDVFVIAPWIPGPRYTSACSSRPISHHTYSATPRPHSQPSGGHSRGMVSRMSSRCGNRPSTVMG